MRHSTRFTYEKAVSFARCNLRLRPIDWVGQTLIDHRLKVLPGGMLSQAPQRSSLAHTTRLVIPGATGRLEIVSEAEVEVHRQPQFPAFGDPDVAKVAEMARTSLDVSDTSPPISSILRPISRPTMRSHGGAPRACCPVDR